MARDSLKSITNDVVACSKCPRLVAWREEVAKDPPARYRGENYWARPLPGFGDPKAGLFIVGLAPAANGGNRTGRIFTGDRSGDWLFRALHKAGFANQPTSINKNDGLQLSDCYIAAVVRSAPPSNRPTPQERDNCLPYLAREFAVMKTVRAIVALGLFAWDGALRALAMNGVAIPSPRPRFGHLATTTIGPYALIGSFHPSQQNTFTGKLTEEAFDEVFRVAKSHLA